MTRTRRPAPSPAGTTRPAAGRDHEPEDPLPLSPAEIVPIHADLGPIIKSKIQPPVLRESTLTRMRLIDRLREATRRRLTLLIAEAGYGKTTLMADFAVQTGTRTVWFRLDPTDADIVTWTNHVIGAMREYEPSFGQATLDLMAHLPAGGPPRSAFVSSVIGELGRLEPVPTVLVLDDFHAVDESDEANEFVVRLTRDAPPWLTLVVSARRRPSFEMGRLTAAGEVAELTTEDLRFSREETSELFAEGYNTPLEDDVLRELDKKVNGWAASLQLFHGSIRGRSLGEVRALARALSGATGPIYEFLAEEVLAKLPEDVERFLMRSSLLERISSELVVHLFGDDADPPSPEVIRSWIDESDRLMLLTRMRGSAEARQLHPLLRDVLTKLLRQRESEESIRAMHLRVAVAVERSQPLVAARHFVEAGEEQAAMRCLNASVMLMMGSGQWGVASDLIGRLRHARVEPAVAAIRARKLIEEGCIDEAAVLLGDVLVDDATPEVRAVIRHSRLSIGWRSGDAAGMLQILEEIQLDPETPQVFRDIAQLLVDSSTSSPSPLSLDRLARRLIAMASTFATGGHSFYAAVALHNASVAHLNAGEYARTVDTGIAALTAFEQVPFFATEQLSTRCVLALALRELGRGEEAASLAREALNSGREFADVPAELAFAAYVSGDRDTAAELLSRARVLVVQRQSDLMGDALVDAASAIAEIDSLPERAVTRLAAAVDAPLDFAYSLSRRCLLAQALLAAGRPNEAVSVAATATAHAEPLHARRAQVRLDIVNAVAAENREALHVAVAAAARAGDLALLETAPTIVRGFEFLDRVPEVVAGSIKSYPQRWLPLIRRVLERGNTRAGHVAATLLDEHGVLEDVGLLRAYAKTYGRRGPGKALGRNLARRLSPMLFVKDLGPVELSVGERTVQVARMRRKAASVLLYLITRPALSANREQVIDELWRDADPVGAVNNLNQSLYFLRREIDPWYEDDVTVDYIHFQGDLVWLDTALVNASSLGFLEAAQSRRDRPLSELAAIVHDYRAPFAPEFEYDDWAMSWRTRLHSTFLDLADYVLRRLVQVGDLPSARHLAAHVLHVDPTATDIERRLVWMYAQLGLHSAARSQYLHLVAQEEADGVEAIPYDQLVRGPLPHIG